jgi:peptidoglycan/LPS O-acetylase OafA/YrhL
MATTTPTTKRRLSAPKGDVDGADAHSGIRFRPDIEGLRALAIALVVLDHLKVPGFRGGFIGVDIFFVISGFLITSLLATEHYRNEKTRNGPLSVSIKAFYMRRARRILPASLTVIAFTLIASKLIFNSIRFPEVQADALWATFFAENLHLMAQATDYFAQGTAVSPLQNYWSLAVEEQFYFIWPVLFIVATLANRNRIKQLTSRFTNTPGSSKRSSTGRWDLRVRWAVIALFVASLAWSIIATANNAAPAYYSPFTRAYELALGAGVALTINTLVGVSETASKALGGIAMALVIAAMFVISPDTAFPGAWALLPTTAAALLIIAGMNPDANTPTGWLLSTPPMRFIGRISYSLYLWHWPIIVFAGALVSERTFGGAPRTIALIAVSVLVSWASYHLIEQPFRRFKLSDSGFEGRFFSHARKWTGTTQDALKLTLMGASMAAVLLTLAAFARPLPTITAPATASADLLTKWANWDGNGPGPDEGSTSSASALPSKGAQRVSDLAAEDVAPDWPAKLVRAASAKVASEAEIAEARVGRALAPDGRCWGVLNAADEERCTLKGTGASASTNGDLKLRKVVLIGDSYASQWGETIASVLPRSAQLVRLTYTGCRVAGPLQPIQACATHRAFRQRELKRLRPDLVVLSAIFGNQPADMTKLVKQLRKLAPTLWIGFVPSAGHFDTCIKSPPLLSRCNASPSAQSLTTAQHRAAAGVGGAQYLDLSRSACTAATCPAFIDNHAVRWDGAHLTSWMLGQLAPLAGAAIRLTVGKPLGQ